MAGSHKVNLSLTMPVVLQHNGSDGCHDVTLSGDFHPSEDIADAWVCPGCGGHYPITEFDTCILIQIDVPR